MKKKCDGCRALSSVCDLGYKTKIIRVSMNGYPSDRKPLEECEKPKTYKEFIYLLDIRKKL